MSKEQPKTWSMKTGKNSYNGVFGGNDTPPPTPQKLDTLPPIQPPTPQAAIIKEYSPRRQTRLEGMERPANPGPESGKRQSFADRLRITTTATQRPPQNKSLPDIHSARGK